ncbi:MAG: bifunctional adenosylcobinamide kinase/adenosylcobinamide-phosphate guanylyltransferase [Actinophytocola sp.]|nr:bifunctional adenosylcobinamide kinase/adenosylcobinamide-phosphate guanylyltransferase [Actinophytocola sp.]
MTRMLLPTPLTALRAVYRTGMRVLDELTTGSASRRANTTLVLGGARSGKSQYAEHLLADETDVVYIATGSPPTESDPEWAERVRAHRQRRSRHWRTVETLDIASVLRSADTPVLVDCLATWFARICDETGAWHDADGWRDRTEATIADLLDALRTTSAPVVLVSNEVGSGIVPSNPAGRLFRDELGLLNRRVADATDAVVLVVAGRALELSAPITPS